MRFLTNSKNLFFKNFYSTKKNNNKTFKIIIIEKNSMFTRIRFSQKCKLSFLKLTCFKFYDTYLIFV